MNLEVTGTYLLITTKAQYRTSRVTRRAAVIDNRARGGERRTAPCRIVKVTNSGSAICYRRIRNQGIATGGVTATVWQFI